MFRIFLKMSTPPGSELFSIQPKPLFSDQAEISLTDLFMYLYICNNNVFFNNIITKYYVQIYKLTILQHPQNSELVLGE